MCQSEYVFQGPWCTTDNLNKGVVNMLFRPFASSLSDPPIIGLQKLHCLLGMTTEASLPDVPGRDRQKTALLFSSCEARKLLFQMGFVFSTFQIIECDAAA